MTIIEDTRQQKGKHENISAYLHSVGVEMLRQKLDVGDYMTENSQTSIDTKYGLQEVYGNLIGNHDRFRRECIRAKESGIHLIVLVEEKGIRKLEDVKTWKNPRQYIYERLKSSGNAKQKAPPVSSERLYGIMRTMSELYGVSWMFCEPNKTGQEIVRILSESEQAGGAE